MFSWVWLIGLAAVLSNGSAGSVERNKSGQQSRLSAGPCWQLSFSRTGQRLPLSCLCGYQANPVKPYARRGTPHSTTHHVRNKIFRLQRTDENRLPHLVVAQEQKQTAFSPTRNQQDERALLRFARPQDLVSKPVKCSFQVEGYIILVTPPLLLRSMVIGTETEETGLITRQRAAGLIGRFGLEVLGRPRHPIFRLPLVVSAPIVRMGTSSCCGHDSDFVAQPNDARKPLDAFCRQTPIVSGSAARVSGSAA